MKVTFAIYIAEVLCYTATYTGQAEAGEVIEVAGQVEQPNTGRQLHPVPV
jgi:predicted nucleotidyltransferase